MFCPECGFENEDENKFCLKCGKSLAPKKQMEKQSASDYDPNLEETRKDQILESAIQAMNSDRFEAYKIAYENLNKISGWKNADELKKQCEEKITELRHQQAIARKKYKKIAICVSAPVAALLVAALVIGILITPKLKYDEAMEYLDNSNYAKASEIFEEIRDYKDASTALTYISVMDGSITDCDEKIEILESLGDYRNAKELLLDAKYEKAYDFSRFGNYSEAVDLLDSLGDYGDPNGIKQNIRKKAVGFFDDRKFSESAELFLILGKYEDSEDYIEKIYQQAGTYYKDKKYNYAASVYMSLGDYSDSLDKIDEIYQKCLEYIDKGKYVEAVPILKNLKDYKDSESELEKIYNKALSLIGDKKYDDAAKIFEKFGKYKESESKLNVIAELKNKEKYDKAVKLGKDEKYDEAIILFQELGDYEDSKAKITEMKDKQKQEKYDYALSLMDQGDYDEALSTFESLGSYKDSETKAAEIEEIIESIQNISGSWIETEINLPHFMEITSNGNNYFYVEIHCDGDNFTWTFSGEYDYKTGLLYYTDGTYVTKYDGISTVQNTNLSGTLSYSNGYIYWSFPANGNKIFEFERG